CRNFFKVCKSEKRGPSSSSRNFSRSPKVLMGGGAKRFTTLLKDSFPCRCASSAATASLSRFTFLLMHAICAHNRPGQVRLRALNKLELASNRRRNHSIEYCRRVSDIRPQLCSHCPMRGA